MVTFFDDAGEYMPLHTREGLESFLHDNYEPPPRLNASAYLAMTTRERETYNEERIARISANLVVRTPQVKSAVELVESLLLSNRGRNSGHAGLMISGEASLGKTTIAKSVMKRVHVLYRREFPDYLRHSRVPVVYIEAPAGSTGKSLAARFAHYLGLSVSPRDSMDQIMLRVIDVLIRAHTQLVVVDELQNLNQKSASNGESIDVLKSFHNRLPCTFVYAGINLLSGGLLSGERGRQMSGRFESIELTRFSLASPFERALWDAVLRRFESDLLLVSQPEGSLVDLSSYLFERSGGSIGSLGRLLTKGTIELIRASSNGVEGTLTTDLLDTLIVDTAAEHNFQIAQSKRSTEKRRRAA